ncbi:MAG TPA: hypothetical protein VGO47_15160 [Chlamydiales bacterium]|nr:hypothetical protein [Chlamydiales bacterium]
MTIRVYSLRSDWYLNRTWVRLLDYANVRIFLLLLSPKRLKKPSKKIPCYIIVVADAIRGDTVNYSDVRTRVSHSLVECDFQEIGTYLH